jgi:hypothetical protein
MPPAPRRRMAGESAGSRCCCGNHSVTGTGSCSSLAWRQPHNCRPRELYHAEWVRKRGHRPRTKMFFRRRARFVARVGEFAGEVIPVLGMGLEVNHGEHGGGKQQQVPRCGRDDTTKFFPHAQCADTESPRIPSSVSSVLSVVEILKASWARPHRPAGAPASVLGWEPVIPRESYRPPLLRWSTG